MPQARGLSIKIYFDPENFMGPGKAELLQRIAEEGSIAAAGRAMGMSYKRAWMLIESLNEMFREPLVTRNRGGSDGGGASLTDTGRKVLALYRDIESVARKAGNKPMADMKRLLKPSHGNGKS
jgi:molybdate transport system regulatory protein